jgi:peptidoglycan/xylan/chitin deacetylase (PgdA/CDA1 family)
MPTPFALPASKDYLLSFWYKTNTLPSVVAVFINAAGNEVYFGLPSPHPPPDASTTWQFYSDTFFVPAGTVLTSAFVFLDRVGFVHTDDFSIEQYTYPPLSRGLVSLVFDDGFEENINTAMPLLNSLGFKTTHCFATIYIEGIASSIAIVQQMASTGHEICAHSVTHPFLTRMNVSQQTYELRHSRDYLRSISGQSVPNFATPFGTHFLRYNREYMLSGDACILIQFVPQT